MGMDSGKSLPNLLYVYFQSVIFESGTSLWDFRMGSLLYLKGLSIVDWLISWLHNMRGVDIL